MYKIISVLRYRNGKVAFRILNSETNKRTFVSIYKSIRASYIHAHFKLNKTIVIKPVETMGDTSINEYYLTNIDKNDGFYVKIKRLK